MKMLGKFLSLAALLFAGAVAEARVGAPGSAVLFVSQGQFSHDNSTTASVYEAATLRRGTLYEGMVIEMEATATIGTVNNDGATMTIGCTLGGTVMLTADAIMDDGRLYVKAVGIVRSVNVSTGAGTILWSIQIFTDNTTAANNNAAAHYVTAFDTTADSFTPRVDNQVLGLSWDWAAADSANTLRVDQFIARIR